MDILLAAALTSHIGFNFDYFNVHPHVGVQYENFIAGAFLNSEKNKSVYGGFRSEFGDFGIEYGVVTGYDKLGAVMPMIRGTYDINDNLRVFAAPAPEKFNESVNYGIVLGIETFLIR